MTVMDKSIPAGAARLLDLIARAETDMSPPAAYEVIIGHAQDKLPKPLTTYTVDELIAAQATWARTGFLVGKKRVRGSAAGAYQIIRKTLIGLKTELGLGPELFDGPLQDRLGYHLLKRRGYEKFAAGRMSVADFGLSLAKEWASFPVLLDTKGASRAVKRGESYYAGDGVNGARIKPAEVESLLVAIKSGSDAPPDPARIKAPELPYDTILSVQQKLRDLGYTEVGKIDGHMGPLTETAILAFRKDNSLPLVTTIDDRLLAALLKAPLRELSAGRAEATAKEVRAEVPEARNTWRTKIGAMVTAIGSGAGFLVTGVLEALPGARDLVSPITETLYDIPMPIYFLLIVGVAGFLWWQSHRGEQSIVEAFQNAERR